MFFTIIGLAALLATARANLLFGNGASQNLLENATPHHGRHLRGSQVQSVVVSNDAECECGDLVSNEGGACDEGPASFIAPLRLGGAALVSAVVFDQSPQTVSEADVHLFCRAEGDATPHVDIATPLYSFTIELSAADAGACVSKALPTPLFVPATCEVLWVEFVTQVNQAAVTTGQECNGAPLSDSNEVWVYSQIGRASCRERV